MKTILITDNLFVLPEHERRLRDAGYGGKLYAELIAQNLRYFY